MAASEYPVRMLWGGLRLFGTMGVMVIYLLYNRQTPGERQVQDIAKQLEREQVEVELVDADASRGIQLAENYGIFGRPAILLVREDGSPVQIWENAQQFPSPHELRFLAHS